MSLKIYFRDRIGIPVASVSIVEMAEHGPLIHIMSDRSHLRERPEFAFSEHSVFSIVDVVMYTEPMIAEFRSDTD